MKIDRNELDNYITGNFGEDQFDKRRAVRTLVFVYGTLRRGLRLHGLMEKAEYKGTGTVNGTLYDLGSYPVVVQNTIHRQVVGEVYAVADRNTRRYLDSLERGAGYERKLTTVTMIDGDKIRAWIYVHGKPRDGWKVINSGDYARYLVRRRDR